MDDQKQNMDRVEKEMDFWDGGWQHFATPSQCDSCKHLYRVEDGARPMCKAFPDDKGIPDDILLNRFVHTRHYPGDHGVKYEKDETASTTLQETP